MAKQAVASAAIEGGGPVSKVKQFSEEVRVEMGKVSWPTKEELKQSTTIVFYMLAVSGVVLTLLDQVFKVIVLNLFRFL